MSLKDVKKFGTYGLSLVISTIVLYFLINILYRNWYIGEKTANMLGCLVLMLPLIFALYLPGIWGDDLELKRMKKRFKFSKKAAVLGVIVIGFGILGGFLVVSKYTSLTPKQYGMALFTNLYGTWYSLLIGAVATEAGFRGFLQTHFEKTYSVLGSALMVGITYSIWKTVLLFISDNPSLPCLMLLALQFIEFSVVAAYLMKWCGENLYPVICFHFIWHLLAHTMKFQSRIEFLLYSDLFLLLVAVVVVSGDYIKKKVKKSEEDK